MSLRIASSTALTKRGEASVEIERTMEIASSIATIGDTSSELASISHTATRMTAKSTAATLSSPGTRAWASIRSSMRRRLSATPAMIWIEYSGRGVCAAVMTRRSRSRSRRASGSRPIPRWSASKTTSAARLRAFVREVKRCWRDISRSRDPSTSRRGCRP